MERRMITIKTVSVRVDLTEDAARYLEALAKNNGFGMSSIAEVLAYLGSSAADGMRRPGAWERGWLEQAVGDSWLDAMEQIPDVPYAQLRPKVSP